MKAPGTKLALVAALVAAVTAYVAYLGASASWQYYLTVDECVADAASLPGQPIRVSGKVARGSLRIAPDAKHAEFRLQGAYETLRVACSGSLADGLAEELEVVVEGRLDRSGTLQAVKVLTRCASKYSARAAQGAPRTATRPTPGGSL
jgi:cytochrome c-type biogenesis protein CcmE